jgi:hypothetical protein
MPRFPIWMPAAIGLALGSGLLPGAETAPPAAKASPREILLEPRVHPTAVASDNVLLESAPTNFLAEPAVGTNRVFRRLLRLTRDTNNVFAVLWDQTQGILYVDLNRNRNLTDDPGGMLTATNQSAEAQSFTNLVLNLALPGGVAPVVLDLRLTVIRSGQSLKERVHGHVGMRSFWEARVSHEGRDWQMGFVLPLVDNSRQAKTGYLVWRPWEDRTNTLSFYASSTGLMPWSDQIFIWNQAWAATQGLEAAADGPRCRLTLSPREPAMMDFRVRALDNLDRVTLRATNGHLALLTGPWKGLRLPQGQYTVESVLLRQGTTEAYRLLYPPTLVNQTSRELALGGPLTNSVAILHWGRTLRLNYDLRGADGQSYRLMTPSPQPPTFEVRKGDRQLITGSFQYG